jgi:hypothetical protein
MEVNMFRCGSFFVRIVGALLLVGVLFAVGALAFQAGQAQGYALAMTRSGEELTTPSAGIPGLAYWGQPYFGMLPSPYLGVLCLFGLGLIFLFALGTIFRPWGWYGHSRGWHADWKGWHEAPPPDSGPWAKEKEAPPTESNPAGPPASSAEVG